MDTSHAIRTVQVGAARVAIVTIGIGRWIMAEQLRAPLGGWTVDDLAPIDQISPVPFQSTHVALGEASVVVDPMDYAVWRDAHGWMAQSWHVSTPRLDRQLADFGIASTDVTHVVLTHAHDDHFSVASVEDKASGSRRPLFPSARYIAQRADWTPEGQDSIQASLLEEERLPGVAERWMGELFRRGMVDLVDGDHDIAPGIRLIHTPGETPGHAVVRVHSNGQTLYVLGDLFHHPIEIEHPDWLPVWVEPVTTLASRRSLMDAALAEDALLVAAHIPGVGRLHKGVHGVHWEPAS